MKKQLSNLLLVVFAGALLPFLTQPLYAHHLMSPTRQEEEGAQKMKPKKKEAQQEKDDENEKPKKKKKIEQSKTKINWIHDYEKGLAKAVQEKKAIFLCFTKPDSKGFEELNEWVLSNEAIATHINKNFVTVLLEVDRESGQNMDLAKRFGISGVPTVFLMDYNEDQKDSFSGVPDERDVLVQLKGFITKYKHPEKAKLVWRTEDYIKASLRKAEANKELKYGEVTDEPLLILCTDKSDDTQEAEKALYAPQLALTLRNKRFALVKMQFDDESVMVKKLGITQAPTLLLFGSNKLKTEIPIDKVTDAEKRDEVKKLITDFAQQWEKEHKKLQDNIERKRGERQPEKQHRGEEEE